MDTHKKYTFTFKKGYERHFREILGRIDASEYTILEDIHPVETDDCMQTIIEMDPNDCLTFRLSMNEVKIHRERTEEEAAIEKERKDKNTIRVNVKVKDMPPSCSTECGKCD